MPYEIEILGSNAERPEAATLSPRIGMRIGLAAVIAMASVGGGCVDRPQGQSQPLHKTNQALTRKDERAMRRRRGF